MRRKSHANLKLPGSHRGPSVKSAKVVVVARNSSKEATGIPVPHHLLQLRNCIELENFRLENRRRYFVLVSIGINLRLALLRMEVVSVNRLMRKRVRKNSIWISTRGEDHETVIESFLVHG